MSKTDTYQVKRSSTWTGHWVPAGETVESFEAALRSLREPSGPVIAWVRNNFNDSVTVFEVNSLGYFDNKGSYESFYGTTVLPA